MRKKMTILHNIWVERIGDRMYAVETERDERYTFVADTIGELIDILNEDLRTIYQDPKREARDWHFGGVEEVYHKIGKVYMMKGE